MAARSTSVVAVLVALTAPAAAAPEHAAVAAIDVGPRVPAHLVAAAKHTIEQGLASSGYAIAAARPLTGALASCRRGDCVRAVAQADHADAIVFAALSMKDESSIVDLVLFDGATGQQLAVVHEVCDLCGEAELDERLGVAASALHAQAAAAAANAVRLNAMIHGAPVAAAPSRVPGYALGIAGLVTIGLGAYAWSRDGHGACSPGDEPVYPAPGAVIRYPNPSDPGQYVCSELYRTKVLGIATVGVGVVAAVAGAVLVVRAHGQRAALEVAPTQGGVQLGATVHW